MMKMKKFSFLVIHTHVCTQDRWQLLQYYNRHHQHHKKKMTIQKNVFIIVIDKHTHTHIKNRKWTTTTKSFSLSSILFTSSLHSYKVYFFSHSIHWILFVIIVIMLKLSGPLLTYYHHHHCEHLHHNHMDDLVNFFPYIEWLIRFDCWIDPFHFIDSLVVFVVVVIFDP